MSDQRTAIGYVRVSTGKQAESGLSLESQEARIVAYCTAMGYRLESVHADKGLSGKTMDRRPGLQTALKAACGSSGILVATDLSRVARSLKDCVAISERLKTEGAGLALIEMAIDTATPTGEFMFVIVAALGQLESSQASVRTKHALAQARKRGVRLGGPRKLSDPQENDIRARVRAGEAPDEVAPDFGVHANTVKNICKRPDVAVGEALTNVG